eukprot:1057461-Pelagomonas_calceolata.AAC.4
MQFCPLAPSRSYECQGIGCLVKHLVMPMHMLMLMPICMLSEAVVSASSVNAHSRSPAHATGAGITSG